MRPRRIIKRLVSPSLDSLARRDWRESPSSRKFLLMIEPTDDLRIETLRPLISPAILMEDLPITETISETVASARTAIAQIMKGENDRLVVVVGPCSIHDPAAALEYAERLAICQRELAADLCVVMRVYFEKPRTTVGWKGLINDPDLDGMMK